MTVVFFVKNTAVMKLISLFAILSMGLPLSGASAATELETLRARCIEQQRQIEILEAQLEKLQPTDSKTTATAKPPMAIVVPEPPNAYAGKTHKIQENETYSHVSRKYNVSVESLVAANPTIKPTALRPGQVIRLSAESPAPEPSPTTATTPQPTVVETPPPAPAVVKMEPAAKTPAVEKSTTVAKMEPVAKTPAPEKSKAVAKTESTSTTVAKTESAPTPPPVSPTSSAPKKIRSVMIDTEISYATFATKHGTNTGRLNDLNGLDLSDATVLAKGSELYVPQ